MTDRCPMHRRASECSKPLYITLLLLWIFEQWGILSVSSFISSLFKMNSEQKNTLFCVLAFLIVQNPSDFWTLRDITYIRYLFSLKAEKPPKAALFCALFFSCSKPFVYHRDFWTLSPCRGEPSQSSPVGLDRFPLLSLRDIFPRSGGSLSSQGELFGIFR